MREHEGAPFFSMAHVEGKPLGDLIRGSQVAVNRICEIGIQLCDGYQAALKPTGLLDVKID